MTAPLQHICVFRFSMFVCRICFSKAREMRRTDLFEATMQGWARLNPQQRQRFFQAGLKAALRLERQEFRAWLMRRLIEPPLAAPVDPASFAISKTDIALLMKSARPKKPFRNAIWITPGLDTIETWGSAVPHKLTRLRGPQRRTGPNLDLSAHPSTRTDCHARFAVRLMLTLNVQSRAVSMQEQFAHSRRTPLPSPRTTARCDLVDD
ncbi:hypothetical protein ACT4MK_27610 [Bradyrhizobium barranii]|uniref:hypothetical protein n=1 Tax=Bradyrhizobium TaxID=374 RepID=UPI0024AEA311|nr:hypothetical protein [Bradyrhizobium barranii]WFT93191.1 hypothetical protein QA633_33475 [Bradyrhizobium barranii]